MLDDLKHHSKTVGLKQTMKALANNKVRVLFIAEDAEERLVSKVLEVCNGKDIEVCRVESMKLLGRKCGIDVGTAVAAIIND
ncbi:MAG: 50S ribosomal protein L7ae-like protein [Clostridiaceae bacterium]|nr:50S ribosomal protein L7ae-like protein [Clostridiaceae bacterium]